MYLNLLTLLGIVNLKPQYLSYIQKARNYKPFCFSALFFLPQIASLCWKQRQLLP